MSGQYLTEPMNNIDTEPNETINQTVNSRLDQPDLATNFIQEN